MISAKSKSKRAWINLELPETAHRFRELQRPVGEGADRLLTDGPWKTWKGIWKARAWKRGRNGFSSLLGTEWKPLAPTPFFLFFPWSPLSLRSILPAPDHRAKLPGPKEGQVTIPWLSLGHRHTTPAYSDSHSSS